MGSRSFKVGEIVLAPHKYIGEDNPKLYRAVVLFHYPIEKWGHTAFTVQYLDNDFGWRLADVGEAMALMREQGGDEYNKTGMAWTISRDYGIELVRPLNDDLLSAVFRAARNGYKIHHDDFKRMLTEFEKNT